MQSFRPDLVDWLIKETENEIAWRRKEQHRVNSFVFFERTLGQAFGLLIGLAAIGGGVYVATVGDHPWIGATITAIGIGGLATAFLAYRGNKRN